MKFLVAQLGARMHYAIPRFLSDFGMLDCFYTDFIAYESIQRILNLLPNKNRTNAVRKVFSRKVEGVPYAKIKTMPLFAARYYNARKNVENYDDLLRVVMKYDEIFCKNIVKKGFGTANCTYTYNCAGLEVMQAAKKNNLKTVMEQTIAPRAIEYEIMSEAATRYPQWGSSLPTRKQLDVLVQREETEWNYADLIICGSSFVRDGVALRGGPVEKCLVVPYGVDVKNTVFERDLEERPLRVLTVGQVGLRKGTPVVWEVAANLVGQVEFRMVGSVDIPTNVHKNKPVNVDLFGTVPRLEIDQHYQWADIFLLPSFCEGSATVTYEAIINGLPVICTHNTGSIIEDGVSGEIVPVFSVDTIVDCLKKYANDRLLLANLKKNIQKVKNDFSYSAYKKRFLSAVSSELGDH